MFILNKSTGIIQECTNADAIKSCRKDPDHYAVAGTKEELSGKKAEEPQKEPEKVTPEGKPEGEQKAPPEGTQGAQEGNGDGEQSTEGSQEPDASKEGANKEAPEGKDEGALKDKSVNDLRKIAKEKGITGYGNMNKDTLIAMIENH